MRATPGSAQLRVLSNPAGLRDLADWGVVPTMLNGQSHTAGVVLHKGSGGESECGVWECTPGTWTCRVERDEFCHFLSGACIYTDASGQETEITPGTIAFFPAGWTGTCRVAETVRKVYMIR